MKDLSGRNAFVTGAANGIGLGLCRALARAGVNVAMADIETEALEKARAELATFNVRTTAIELDVTEADAFGRAADAAEATLGPIHIVCNNAGVTLPAKPVAEVSPTEWDWLIGVNLRGVINGISTFTPRLLRHGEGGHIVNTASIGGLQVNPNLRNGSYSVTKYAVVALSEALEIDLKDAPVGVSVLCPGLVATTLAASARRRPARLGGPSESEGANFSVGWLSESLSPDFVGERVVRAIEADEFFVFTHSEPRAWIERRHDRLIGGFERLDRYKARAAEG
ncbi:MAG: SDR family NAD(P)-dependent oxidoreductase [Bradyrhizobium sp.]